MSGLFKQISQEAAQQRAQITENSVSPTPAPADPEQARLAPVPTAPISEPKTQQEESRPVRTSKIVVPQSGTMAPQKPGDLPKLDMDKLKIVIEELSTMPTNYNGLNVRMSEQETQDIEDFVMITLRKQGLRGYDVSIAKLMRYALRYMFRVHEKEFITALKQVLKTEETLSI